MNQTIEINARYFLLGHNGSYDVLDKALELQLLPAMVFANGTEEECRDYVYRNYDEPAKHAPSPFWTETILDARNGRINVIAEEDGTIITELALSIAGDEEHNREQRANAALFKTSPALLALLEQYHKSFPTKESGKLIAQAKGWI